MSKQLRLPTLLIVTENPSIRFWVKKHLDEQFFILAAQSPKEALDALNARLDFIIVDAAMEECDALQLCDQLSKQTQRGVVPILLITGRLKKSFRDKALNSGVTDFLSDQLDLEELETRIATGQKAASARQKTEDLSQKIKVTPLPFGGSLKTKLLLTDQALRWLAEAKSDKISVSLLLIQIDNYKESDIIQPLTAFVGHLLRPSDLLIPFPEERFAVLLSNMDTQRARLVAERLRNSIRDNPFETPNGPLQLSVSIAVSSLEASEQGVNKMIDSAIKSLKTHSETNLIISLDQENL